MRQWLSAYPALEPWELDGAAAGSDGWPSPEQSLHLHRDLDVHEDPTRDAVSASFTRYRGGTTCFAALPGEAAARHPLMLWWSVLHALSMLTRYSPARWSAAIDVDRSPSATRLELLLDVALAAAPDLVDEAFDDLSPR